MVMLSPAEKQFMTAISRLDYCNPFVPDRITLEREALGPDFNGAATVWSKRVDLDAERANVGRLITRVESLVEQIRPRLRDGTQARPDELNLYEDLVLFMLYHRYRARLHETIVGESQKPPRRIDFWDIFLADCSRYLRIPGFPLPAGADPDHMFASFFQIRRAFYHIYQHIVGATMPVARLRAAVWESIFTHDMRRYRRSMYDRMGDITTLITGPSGTGKELVARAVGLARYIPFDAKSQRFTEDFSGSFYAMNLSALSPTLIESELFGHRRGAFTGAVEDRIGWLQQCPPLGTVFLDEIGELDASIQVKLLRVLQTRTFERLGDTKTDHFNGKIIAATNRDLAAEMHSGRFRTDFYYRICSDIITTPSLSDQLADSPAELHVLALFIAKRIAPQEADSLADEVASWVQQHLGADYPWPGNFRELEQCVRNVLIRKSYHPQRVLPSRWDSGLIDDIRNGSLTAEALLRQYCTIVYRRCGSYESAARQLQLDRRTVKAKVDAALLERITAEESQEQ